MTQITTDAQVEAAPADSPIKDEEWADLLKYTRLNSELAGRVKLDANATLTCAGVTIKPL